MSFKRIANTELNHDNWNDEQQSEEAGEFKKAPEDVLNSRVKKVAKRRINESDSSGQAINPFGGFGGFGTATSTPSPFSFLSKLPAANNNSTNNNNSNNTKTNGESKKNDEANKSNNTEYYSKVKSLNTAFVDWIKSNVDENKGLCDLTPVFKDYEKYMKECQELKNKKPQSEVTNTVENKEKEPPITSSFTFGKPTSTASSTSLSIFSSAVSKIDSPTKSVSSPSKAPENKPFSFGIAPSNSIASNLSSAPSFSFGAGLQKTSTAINAPLFGNITSGGAAPFSFSNVTQNTTTDNAGTADNEEAENEEPPKNEFVPVVEEDSLYSKRCKVFVKSGADYADRGIGTLYLKKVEEKVQLIVRADTNLGNILLNIIICEGLPTSRLGKNNVMIVCLPTPESKPPPIPVLVRVKTSDEADELLATIEKYKPTA